MTASVTYTFRNQSGPIPLNELDTNFQDLVTAINTNQTAALAAVGRCGIFRGAIHPGLAFGGASVGMTFSAVRYGAYILVGNIVFFALEFRLTAKGSSTGLATVTGLPFTQSTTFPTGSGPWISVQVGTVTFASGYICGLLAAPTMSLFNVKSATGVTGTPLSETEFANTSSLQCSGFYVKA